MTTTSYMPDGNALVKFYLEKEYYLGIKSSTPMIIALEEFLVEDLKRLDEKSIYVSGSLLILTQINEKYKSSEKKIRIPILYDEYDQFGRKQELSKPYFEGELNNFNDNFVKVSENITIISGQKADDLWKHHLAIRKNVFPEDANKYPDIPERIRANLELVFRKYKSNKAYKERYDKLYKRFVYLSDNLKNKYPNEVHITNYKGMPVLYLKGENEFQVGKHRIFMTPMNCYSISKDNYIRRFYDLSETSIKQSLFVFNNIEPKYFVCSERLEDLKNIVNNLNLRKKLIK